MGLSAVWDVRRLGLSAVWDSAPDRSDPMTFKVSAPSAVTDGVESAVKMADVTPDYLAVMGMPLVAGHIFDETSAS